MNIDDISPITVTEDRYHGVYTGWHLERAGEYIAWHNAEEDVPNAPFKDRSTARAFWIWVREYGYVVGIGNTPADARADLVKQIVTRPDYDPAKQPKYLGDWKP